MIVAIIDAGRPFSRQRRLLGWTMRQTGMKVCKVFGFSIQRQIYFGTFEPKETGIVRAI
jgi:hypothetical protein